MKSQPDIFTSMPVDPGNGSIVQQPLPRHGLRNVGPFILLHHFGPDPLPAGKGFDVPPHPHRGFEPVTFLFEGAVEHRDSAGNHGRIEGGGAQWMTAGSGVLHSERTPDDERAASSTIHGVQLWVNLPRASKMVKPRYQDISPADIPALNPAPGLRLRLYAGSWLGATGPAETHTPLVAAHLMLEPGTTADLNLPDVANWQGLIYTLKGTPALNGWDVPVQNMALLPKDDREITLSTTAEPAELLLLTGQPINEPMVSYGPFVMNSQQEIWQAIADYEAGKMGKLGY